jgi:hypothetical protein
MMALQRLATSLALLSLGVRASDWRGISPELQQKLSAVSSVRSSLNDPIKTLYLTDMLRNVS